MIQTIAITSKWQIHFPVEFRKALALKKPGLAEIRLLKDGISVKPKASPLLKLAGKYRHRKPIVKINLDKIREQIDYSQL